jgi:hypothetical protein
MSRKWLGADTPFPERKAEEVGYELSRAYQSLFSDVLDYCRALSTIVALLLRTFAGSCPWWWCRSAGSLQVSGGPGRFCQAATAGNLTKGSLLNGAIVSSVM